MDYEALTALLDSLRPVNLLVLGDVILDRYTWGDATRISQEAPVLVLTTRRQEERLGGAANVANMAATLGARVTIAGVTGRDEAGGTLCGLLERAKIDTSCLLRDSNRPTTVKQRFMGQASGRHANQILRVDCESTCPLASDLEHELQRCVAQQLDHCDAVLVADYNKGVCSPGLLEWLLAECHRRGVATLVDPGQGRDLMVYRTATLIKPNRRETEIVTGRQIRRPDEAIECGRLLCERGEFEMACITLDADGMALVDRHATGRLFPTQARAVYDITGAGDMVLATLGYCLAQGVSAAEAVQLANVAAGLEVEQNGVVVVRIDEIRSKLHGHLDGGRPKQITLTQARSIAESYRVEGRRIVFTNGCFDLLHVGHVSYLAEAAALGDVLFVGVNADASVRRLKGPQRPVINQTDRAAMLASLACVDHVLVFEQDTPHQLLEAIRPDVLVKGGTYQPHEVVGHEVVTAYGGRVAVTGMVDGVSTSGILQSLADGAKLRRAG